MSKPAWITDAVIANSKKIYELGGRFEVSGGSWMLWVEEKNCPENVISLLVYVIGPGCAGMFYDRKNLYSSMLNNFIPIWDSQKCKNWLRKKGYDICRTYSDFDSSDNRYCDVYFDGNDIKTFPLEIEAPTEDEACELAVIKVLQDSEGNKNKI